MVTDVVDNGAGGMKQGTGAKLSDPPITEEEQEKLDRFLAAALRLPSEVGSRNKFYLMVLGGAFLSVAGLFLAGYLAFLFFDL